MPFRCRRQLCRGELSDGCLHSCRHGLGVSCGPARFGTFRRGGARPKPEGGLPNVQMGLGLARVTHGRAYVPPAPVGEAEPADEVRSRPRQGPGRLETQRIWLRRIRLCQRHRSVAGFRPPLRTLIRTCA